MGTPERVKVESFADRTKFGQIHDNLLLTSSEYREAVAFFVLRRPEPPSWIRITDGCATISIWNLDPQYKSRPEKQGHCAAQEDLKGLLGCLYLIRCHLFHGDKQLESTLDEAVLQAGFYLLSSLLLAYDLDETANIRKTRILPQGEPVHELSLA